MHPIPRPAGRGAWGQDSVRPGQLIRVSGRWATRSVLPSSFPNTIVQHELTHVLASEFGLPFLGLARSAGLLEGLATAIEGFYGDYPLDYWAKTIFAVEQNLPVQTVLSGLNFFKLLTP